MYVTTFYSFKGGVGRTMALVNVAVELARRGRRVLAVDFDLEAPGLDTFDLPRPKSLTPGLVDFVGEYLETGQAPDVRDFVFESSGIGNQNGGLWIMPSGAHRENYAGDFAKIDWNLLYERHDGYLLFEDLKEQWKASVQPDYVLIDSRTGHTDVGGICTRQLPNAVAVLFFPNTQNLRGLTKIVRDIRSENTRHPNRSIKLHFIMSNVPDLDDEDSILRESITSFEKILGFRDPVVIHRYDSLSLLNQAIFTKDRPRSRLAKEYHAVTAEIMQLNPEDRDGALDFLAQIGSVRHVWHTPSVRFRPRLEVGKHLETIEKSHRTDGEVLFRIGSFRENFGRFEDAADLFDRAIKAGYTVPEVYLRRAYIRRRELDDENGARQDASTVINSEKASTEQVVQALSIIGSEQLEHVVDSPAVSAQSPEERVWIADQLNTSSIEAEAASRMLRPLLTNAELSMHQKKEARQSLVLACMAARTFSEAIETILAEEPDVRKMSIASAFNYGMALWGRDGEVTQNPFDRALECHRAEPRSPQTPNYLQCMAVAHWTVGETSAAREIAKDATREIRSRGGQEFSCWRYLRVPRSQFEGDIDEFLSLVDGDEFVRPRYHPSKQ